MSHLDFHASYFKVAPHHTSPHHASSPLLQVHQLEAQLAMAKEFADEMRTSYLELAEHSAMLDEEAEEMQRELFALRK